MRGRNKMGKNAKTRLQKSKKGQLYAYAPPSTSKYSIKSKYFRTNLEKFGIENQSILWEMADQKTVSWTKRY